MNKCRLTVDAPVRVLRTRDYNGIGSSLTMPAPQTIAYDVRTGREVSLLSIDPAWPVWWRKKQSARSGAGNRAGSRL